VIPDCSRRIEPKTAVRAVKAKWNRDPHPVRLGLRPLWWLSRPEGVALAVARSCSWQVVNKDKCRIQHGTVI
jgi:hypothetical protein